MVEIISLVQVIINNYEGELVYVKDEKLNKLLNEWSANK